MIRNTATKKKTTESKNLMQEKGLIDIKGINELKKNLIDKANYKLDISLNNDSKEFNISSSKGVYLVAFPMWG